MTNWVPYAGVSSFMLTPRLYRFDVVRSITAEVAESTLSFAGARIELPTKTGENAELRARKMCEAIAAALEAT
jgi:hypothetical protein